MKNSIRFSRYQVCWISFFLKFQIGELNEIIHYKEGVSVGAAVTLSEVQDKLRNITSICTLDQTRAIQQVLKMFHWFAGKQIRNCATLGGKEFIIPLSRDSGKMSEENTHNECKFFGS